MFAAFVLNLPARVFGGPVPVWPRAAGLLGVVAVYYLLWMLVAAAYWALSEPTPAAEKHTPEKPVRAKAA
jgi:hypothetical protein